MSEEEERKAFEEYMSGNTVKPPRGSVVDDYDLSGGPPMMRLLLIQSVFQFIIGIRGFTKKFKAFLIGCVCVYLCWYDI